MSTAAEPRGDTAAEPRGDTAAVDAALTDLAAVVDRVGAEGTARTRTVRDAGGRVDRAMWRRFGDLGWLGLGVPEELGGAGAGERAVAAVAGRLGAGAFPEPYTACGVRIATLLAGPSPEGTAPAGKPGAGARALLDDVVAGTRVVTLAHDPGAALPTLTDDAGGHVLSGRVRWVPVPDADTVLVAAAVDGVDRADGADGADAPGPDVLVAVPR
ncbi:MAG: acyl-CoA dehydrogenase family protein, partial [Pseudonocardia sediminis]